MRSAVVQSVGVGVGVAVASRTGEWALRSFCLNCRPYVYDAVGMSIAGITAGLLFFLWRYQHRQRVLLVHERERAIRHVHHHMRNSLQVIMYRTDDPIVKSQIQRILTEVEAALPSRSGRNYPVQTDTQ